MVPTAMSQKETFSEERHREAPCCDRQCEKLRGRSAINSEFDRGCGWYGEDDAYDQSTEVHLCASRLVECGGAHASCVVSPRRANNALHCGQSDTRGHRLAGDVLCVDVQLGRDGVVNRRVVAHIGRGKSTREL